MSYYIDLSLITIDAYKTKLETSDLLPSRMILKEKLDERFASIKKLGISNIKELQQALKKKDTFKKLVEEKCLTDDYLTILLREINSIQPKPNKLKEFTGISPETVTRLEKIGIKDTAKLFDNIKTPERRKELALTTGIKDPEITELTKLTDISRIRWVGVTFARMLYDIGIDTVEKASNSDYADVHTKINRLIKERNLYKIQIGLHDMKLFVEAAKELPLEIEY